MKTMRVIRFTLMTALLLMLATACFAQMQQPIRSSVQLGPVLRAGLPASTDVFVDGRFAMRIPTSAGGMSPMQRAQSIADRIDRVFAQGMSWESMRVSRVSGLWAVTADGMIVATADVNSARAFRMQTSALASRWARQTVVAMGGNPQMIAMQLQPISARVAGAREELATLNWMVSPAKSVPLLSAVDGSQIGNVMVGGSSSRLNMANAVVVYESSADNTTIRTFVPISSTSISDPLMRVQGVGLVGIPSDMISVSGMMAGDEVMMAVTQMSSQWNNLVNSNLAQNSLQVSGNTKVVPLYSMNVSRVIGAAQIVGNSSAISNAQAVVLSSSDNMLMFGAISSPVSSISAQSAMLNNVVVSAIMYMPQSNTMPPAPEETPAPSTGETTPAPGY